MLNILSPCLLEELIEDVADSYFSIIMDGSTTVDTKKVMCFMIRYFSQKRRRVHTNFYRLVELESGTAASTTTAFTNQLEKDNLKLENLLGIGIDGENKMAGAHNSVSSELTKKIPHLVTVKCLPHSLHLCAEHACDVLPRHLDFLIKEAHSWFSNSTDRNVHFSQLYETIVGKKPKKIPKLSGTRWLVRLDSIDVVLEEWDELRLHFDVYRKKLRGEAGFKSQQLYEMFSSEENKLYLTFLKHALKNVIGLNKLFQSDSVEPLKLLNDLNDLFFSTLQKIVVPQQLERVAERDLCEFPFKNFLMPVECVQFGYYFNELSSKCNAPILTDIKQRCRDFYIKLAEEFQKRVPNNVAILQKISLFTPENASRQFKADITDIASFFSKVCEDVEETNNRWMVLHRLEIKENSSNDYWSQVMEKTDAAGIGKFRNIAKLAVSLLSLPFSNASVERAFSIVNILKDKLRNRLNIETVDALMRIRFLIKPSTCANFEPSKKMIEKFTSENVYQSNFDTEMLDAFNDM